MSRHRDPPGTKTSCRSCRAEIVWVVTETGKRMPCDFDPVAGGLFYLFRDPDQISAVHVNSKSERAAKAFERGQNRYTSHFSTCPNAKAHRR